MSSRWRSYEPASCTVAPGTLNRNPRAAARRCVERIGRRGSTRRSGPPSRILVGPSTLAQLVDPFLHVEVGEAGLSQAKASLEPQAINDVLRPRRQQKPRLHVHAADERRLFGVHRQPHEILDSAGVHAHVEDDAASPDVFGSHHGAAGQDGGLHDARLHAFEPGVAIRAVHHSFERRRERDRLAGDSSEKSGISVCPSTSMR